MVSKSRADAARDVRMWSGLGLFIGFVFEVVAAAEAFGNGARAVPFALVGIGFMLGGIGARLQYLAPRAGSSTVEAGAAGPAGGPAAVTAAAPDAASDAQPESAAEPALDSAPDSGSDDWPSPPKPSAPAEP